MGRSYDNWKTSDPSAEYDDTQGESFVWEHDADTHGDWLNSFLCDWIAKRDGFEVPLFSIDDLAGWLDENNYINNITDVDDVVINDAYTCDDEGFDENLKAIDSYIKSLD